VHLLAVAIPRFILIEEPLLFLHTMAQSWCGVAQSPPEFESPHALIEPLALRAAKAYAFE
jgi:hypothetical protein